MIRSQKIKKENHVVIYFEIGNRISQTFENYILLISLFKIKIWMSKGFKKWCEICKTLIPFQRDAIKDHEASNKHK
jgi:IS1 family transposase